MSTTEERQAAWIKVRAEAYEVSLARHTLVPPKSASAFEPAPVRRTTDAEAQRTEQWQRYIDGRIDAALAKLWPEIAKGTAMSIVRTVTELRAEMQEQIGSLRADITIEKARTSGALVELPKFLSKRDAG